MFSSQLTKSKAEKFRAYILQAFESVMGSPLTIEIRCELQKDVTTGVNMPLVLPGSQDCLSKVYTNAGLMSSNRMATVAYNDISKRVLKERDGLTQAQVLQPDLLGLGTSEIVEISSPGNLKDNEHETNNAQCDRRDVSTMASLPEQRKLGEQNRSLSLVRSKVSLAHIIQQAEGCSQRNGWSKRKAFSIAEKLEQENLYAF